MKRSTGPRKTVNLSKALNHQLNSYALAASAAGVGVLALAPPVAAEIVYTPAHVVITPKVNSKYVLDLNHDGRTDFFLRATAGSDGYGHSFAFLGPIPAQQGNKVWDAVRTYGTSGDSYAVPLRAGTRVGAKGPLWESGFAVMCEGSEGQDRGLWCTPVKGYLGLSFVIDGKTHYGWARLRALANKTILTGYAYETVANKAIVTGKTHGPDVVTVQPGSLGRLARGASDLPAWRETNSLAKH